MPSCGAALFKYNVTGFDIRKSYITVTIASIYLQKSLYYYPTNARNVKK